MILMSVTISVYRYRVLSYSFVLICQVPLLQIGPYIFLSQVANIMMACSGKVQNKRSVMDWFLQQLDCSAFGSVYFAKVLVKVLHVTFKRELP
jgi:hypothetical protein